METLIKILIEKVTDIINGSISKNVDYKKEVKKQLSKPKFQFAIFLWDEVLDCKFSWKSINKHIKYVRFKDVSAPIIVYNKTDIKFQRISFFIGLVIFFCALTSLVPLHLIKIDKALFIAYLVSMFFAMFLMYKNGDIFILLKIEKELNKHYENHGLYHAEV